MARAASPVDLAATTKGARDVQGARREAKSGYPALWLSWSVWGVAALFYLFAFYLRVSPAVMTTELMRDFRITAAELGTFSAFYFYAYVLMQLPTGVLVDLWGARKLLIVGTLAAAAGTFIFGFAPSYAVASAGRALIGASTAVAWVITLKLATHWFPAGQFATLSGIGLFIGNIGALFAQVPLRMLLDHFDWRTVALISGAIILALTLLAWAFVKNDPEELGFESYSPPELRHTRASLPWGERFRGLGRIFTYRNVVLIFLAQGGFLGALLSFTGLWGPPYLRVRFAVPATTAAAVCSVMVVCFAVASPLFGYLSDKIGRRKPLYLGGALVAAAGWGVLFYAPGVGLTTFIAVAAVTSFAAGAIIIGFAFAKESVPIHFLGTVSGAVNMGNMIGPMLLQPAIGSVLDRRWSGAIAGGLRVYHAGDFQAGFLLIVAWSILTIVLVAFTRETFCKQAA
ncbi:MAG TPA: MFS transporter [Vicinamibacterales bacterium]|jgi:MFS family permease|nr:MFS transporter [Vicinamibacterales bacterium]